MSYLLVLVASAFWVFLLTKALYINFPSGVSDDRTEKDFVLLISMHKWLVNTALPGGILVSYFLFLLTIKTTDIAVLLFNDYFLLIIPIILIVTITGFIHAFLRSDLLTASLITVLERTPGLWGRYKSHIHSDLVCLLEPVAEDV